jgi:hypothetical protein
VLLPPIGGLIKKGGTGLQIHKFWTSNFGVIKGGVRPPFWRALTKEVYRRHMPSIRRVEQNLDILSRPVVNIT